MIWRFFIIILLSAFAVKAEQVPVRLGIDVLESQEFACLKGKKVGLVTHAAGVNGQAESTIDVLARAPQVKLIALFGPEHGLRGDHKADQTVNDARDAKTNLPIHSLYGKTRRPTTKMLEGIEVMVVDLQDIGVRSYTYVSCLCYVMEECFKRNIPVIVLDRPNPLGGMIVDGPPRDNKWQSYVGYLPVPYVHGLTIGEIAQMALKEGWLALSWMEHKEAMLKKQLTIIPMKGWTRSMAWDQTGLTWLPTSPYIPTPGAALGYAMTGLGAQLGGFGHGIGTPYPFRFLTFPGKTPEALKAALEAKNIPGLRYIIRETTKKGTKVRGVYVVLNNWQGFHPTQLSLHMMQLAAEWNTKNPFAAASVNEAELFNKHTGDSDCWAALCKQGAGIPVTAFLKKWEKGAQVFKEKSKQYYLY